MSLYPQIQPQEARIESDYRAWYAGYQYIIYAGFVLALPLCIILQSYRVAAVALICRNGPHPL